MYHPSSRFKNSNGFDKTCKSLKTRSHHFTSSPSTIISGVHPLSLVDFRIQLHCISPSFQESQSKTLTLRFSMTSTNSCPCKINSKVCSFAFSVLFWYSLFHRLQSSKMNVHMLHSLVSGHLSLICMLHPKR
jgi:hypothetical protein